MEPSSSSPLPPPTVSFSDDKKKNAAEDVWSELHALRRLYGLLQQSTGQKEEEEEEKLDDKSLLLLRKLLDNATHQAIQSQSKIMIKTPEENPTPPEIEFLRGGGLRDLNKNPTRAPEIEFLRRGGVRDLNKNPTTAPEIEVVGGGGGVRDLNKNPTHALEKKLEFEFGKVCAAPEEGEKKKTTSSSARNRRIRRGDGRIGSHYLNPSPRQRSTATTATSSGIGYDRPNHHKRFRIEMPSVSERNNKVNLVVKSNSMEKVTGQHSLKREDDRNRRRVGQTESRVRPVRRVSIDSKHSCRSSRHSGNPIRLGRAPAERVHRPPAHRPKKLPTPSPLNSSFSSANSRLSSSSSSSSSSSNRIRIIRRRQNSGCGTSRLQSFRSKPSLPRHPTPPKSPPRTHAKLLNPSKSSVKKPHRANSGEEDVNVGRKKDKGNLRRRIKEKLSFIFHHHHHHHHYNDDGDEGRPRNIEEPPSPALLKHVGSGRNSNKGKEVEVSGERAVEKAHHGYLHMLLDGLIRHLRHSGRNKEEKKKTKMKKKKVKKKKADGGRKLHWWHVWKKRGGINLNSRARKKKKSNLKLAFTEKKKK